MNKGRLMANANERGLALVTVLVALSTITLIGLSMTFVSTTESLINRNTKMRLIQQYASESAAEEARERVKEFLLGGSLSLSDLNQVVYLVASPSINPTSGSADTNPYFDPAFSPPQTATIIPSSLGSIPFAWVKIFLKTEARAGYQLDDPVSSSNSDAVVHYGYNFTLADAPASQYVNSGTRPTTHTGAPVYLVTALSKDAFGFAQLVQAEVSAVPLPPLRAALFSRGPVLITGSNVMVSGTDEASNPAEDRNGVESQDSIGGNLSGVAGSPLPTYPSSPFSYDIDAILRTLKPPISRDIQQVAPAISRLPDGSYAGDGVNLGQTPSAGDVSIPVFADGPLSISNSTGQGVLVVNGDLTISGSFSYYGVIIAKGRLNLDGGVPGIVVRGTIISSSPTSQTSLLQGDVQVFNNSYYIRKQMGPLGQLDYTRLNIRELRKLPGS
ncbi:MAG: hypothetical protein AB1898_03765 [Acidobacteriota bacterium]